MNFELDSRAAILQQEIKDTWEENIKKLHYSNKKAIQEGLEREFGSIYIEDKIKNFCDLGSTPFSIVAFHNKFLRQIRHSFVIGAYYPALTGVCSLGERVLNHLILLLRDDFRNTPEYKGIYRKNSFDDWDLAIKVLSAWKIFLPEVIEKYEKLHEIRNKEAIHFKPAIDTNDRDIALRTIKTFQEIIEKQFGAFGTQPWFIEGVKGASYIKKEYEKFPFIRKVYLPNCVLVGPYHKLELDNGYWKVNDIEYDNKEITDREFADLLEKNRTGNPI